MWYLVAASFCQPTFAKPRAAAKLAANAKATSQGSLIKRGKHWWVDPGAAGASSGADALSSLLGGSSAGSGASSGSSASGGSQLGATSSSGSGSGKLGGLSGLGGTSSQSGSGGSSGSSASSGGGPLSVTMDDSQAKGQDAGKYNNSGGKVSGGNGPNGANPQSKAFNLFYPICLFMDGAVVSKAEGNQTIKEMTDDMAKKCGVNLVVFPITVRPGSYDPSPLAADKNNDLQSAMCNIKGNIPNVTNASTSFCVNSPRMADEMCGSLCDERDNPDQKVRDANCAPEFNYRYKKGSNVAGCAMVNSKNGSAEFDKFKDDLKQRMNQPNPKGDPAIDADKKKAEKRYKELEEHGSPSAGAAAAIAPSIEDAGQCKPTIVAHESIGHSMMGMPNGTGMGNGIGLLGEGEGPDGDGWLEPGCAVIIKNAMVNDGTWRWDPNRQTYYTPPTNPEGMWDFNSGRKLFSSPGAPPPAAGAQPPKIVGGGKTIIYDDGAAKGQPAGDPGPEPKKSSGSGASAVASSDPTDPRHKKRAAPAGQGGETNAEKITKAGKGVAGDSDFPEETSRPRTPPPTGKAKGTISIVMNDNAAKNIGGAGGANATIGPVGKAKVDQLPQLQMGRAQYPSDGGNGNTQSITFNDDAPKGQGAGPGPESAQLRLGPPSSSKGGVSITTNDDAPKGQAPGSASFGSTGGGRGPASVGPSFGRVSGDTGPGLSGSEFFSGVGRTNELSDQERDELQRLRRRKKLNGAAGEAEPIVSRRPRNDRRGADERRPRAISEGGQE